MLGDYFGLSIITALIDIAIVAVLLYWLMLLLKGTRAARMAWGIGVIVVIYLVSESAGLMTLRWILGYFLGSIIIVIIVVFQQDIRRGLLKMGDHFSSRGQFGEIPAIDDIVAAVRDLSLGRVGALIAMEREDDVKDVAEAGCDTDARLSKELIMTIFNPASPLHDGAVIVKGCRITRAGAIFPLTNRELPGALGTRHRAAVGITEETDAVVVVVSEETGDISISIGGELTGGYDHHGLTLELKRLFVSAPAGRSYPWPFSRGRMG